MVLAALLEAAAGLRRLLAGVQPGELSGAECVQLSEELLATERVCGAVRLATVARAIDSGAHASAGFKDPATWLARQSGSTGVQARRDLETATRLESCPDTRDALLAGDISLAQAAEIVQAESATPGVESTLVGVARSADLTRLRERAREERQARTPVDDLHGRQRRARFFKHWRDQLGMVCFSGALPPEVGVPFANRMDMLADRAKRQARAESASGDPERFEAYAADGFTELLSQSGGRKRSSPTEMVVVCDLGAYRRGHAHPGEVCQIIGGGPVPVDVAKEVAEDAFIKAVLYSGTQIHTVRHLGRHIPAELRTALDLGPVPEFTGRECTECGKKWGLEYDHIDPVGNEGPTSYDNVQALCWADHHAKTERDRRAGLIGGRPRRPPDDVRQL